MTQAAPDTDPVRAAWTASVFDRIVCGLDGSEGGRIALDQADRLLGARRSVRLIGLLGNAESTGHRLALERQLHLAHALHLHIDSSLADGEPGAALVGAARDGGATLTVVAAAPYAWPGGSEIVDAALRHAPASVLVSRPPVRQELFPRSIVAASNDPAARAVAEELAHRFGAELRLVGPTFDELVDASTSADLVVAGGADADRIARAAYSSVLVVREPCAAPAV